MYPILILFLLVRTRQEFLHITEKVQIIPCELKRRRKDLYLDSDRVVRKSPHDNIYDWLSKKNDVNCVTNSSTITDQSYYCT